MSLSDSSRGASSCPGFCTTSVLSVREKTDNTPSSIASMFTAVITSLVSDILLPPLSIILPLNKNLEEKFAVLRKGPQYDADRGYNTLEIARNDGAVVLAYGYFYLSLSCLLGTNAGRGTGSFSTGSSTLSASGSRSTAWRRRTSGFRRTRLSSTWLSAGIVGSRSMSRYVVLFQLGGTVADGGCWTGGEVCKLHELAGWEGGEADAAAAADGVIKGIGAGGG